MVLSGLALLKRGTPSPHIPGRQRGTNKSQKLLPVWQSCYALVCQKHSHRVHSKTFLSRSSGTLSRSSAAYTCRLVPDSMLPLFPCDVQSFCILFRPAFVWMNLAGDLPTSREYIFVCRIPIDSQSYAVLTPKSQEQLEQGPFGKLYQRHLTSHFYTDQLDR